MNRPAPNGSAGRVLIVEDDEGIREMLKYNLSTAGFLVHEAGDGASGLRTARLAMTPCTAICPAPSWSLI